MLKEEDALRMATHRHYKGGLYRWLGVASHSKDGTPMVVYLHVWPHMPRVWVRPASLFHGLLEDGSTPRFASLGSTQAPLVEGLRADALEALADAIWVVHKARYTDCKEVSALVAAAVALAAPCAGLPLWQPYGAEAVVNGVAVQLTEPMGAHI